MANKLLEYKNRFRLRVPICESTHDFSRKLDGSLEDIDIYVDCACDCKIFHYGHKIFEAYIPSIQRGHNILKQLYYENINPNNVNVTEKEMVARGTKTTKLSYHIINNDLYKSELKSSGFSHLFRNQIRKLSLDFTKKILKK